MDLIAVLIGLWMVAAAVYWLWRFDAHVAQRYRYRFLTVPAWMFIVAAIGFSYAGCAVYQDARDNDGDVVTGILLVIVGLTIAAMLTRQNLLRTNLAYGVAGTLAQVFVLGIVVQAAIPLIILYVLSAGASSGGASPASWGAFGSSGPAPTDSSWSTASSDDDSDD